MIKNLACLQNKTLLQAMQIINKNALGVCFVVDEFNYLKGVVTDGDIRRAILKNVTLDTKISEITNENFVFGYEGHINDELLNDHIKCIPIVDENNKLLDYYRGSYQSKFPIANPNLDGNELAYLTDAFLSTWISNTGSYVDKFEDMFANYSDCKYGVSVSNGTAALHLALLALEIGEGDEVIVPDLTFAATINAVLYVNATPVIVDVEEDSWCINPKEIKKAITNKTKAIIPVHLYGQVCDMGKIMDLAEQYNLKIIEDCAEAHGAMFKNKKVGSFGDIGCFSFYGNKVITTGEGGMCTTNNAEFEAKIRLLKNHGMNINKRYWHDVIGFNYRMTNLQAAIGFAQLQRIESIHKNRRQYEDNYKKILSAKNFKFQNDLKNRTRITWLAGVLVKENYRDEFMEKLRNNGIEARPFFYLLSEMDIYKKYSSTISSVAKKISRCGVNLPTYESLNTLKQIELIFKKIF